MRFRDKMEAKDTSGNTLETVGAYVWPDETQANFDDDIGQLVLVETLKAMVKPTKWARSGRVWHWNGGQYTQRGNSRVHKRYDKEHHYTIYLDRTG